jgi:uncharacterized protein with PIN domain
VNYRVCLDCGEEFRPEISRCSDCGGDLSEVYEDEAGRAVPPPRTVEPSPVTEADLADFRPIFVGAHAAQLVPLAERLRAEGIELRLAEELKDPERGTASFSLLVREKDRARALLALAPLLGDEAGGDRLHAVESHFEASGRYSRCPACDTEIAPGAIECPECGLVVAGGGGET